MAERSRIAINACFLYLIKKEEVTKFNLDNIKMTTGSSKNKPLKNVEVVIIDI